MGNGTMKYLHNNDMLLFYNALAVENPYSEIGEYQRAPLKNPGDQIQ